MIQHFLCHSCVLVFSFTLTFSRTDWQGGVCGKRQCVFLPQGCWEWVDDVCVSVGWRLCVFWFGVCLCNDAFLSAFKTFPVFFKQSPLLEVCGRPSVARQIHRVLWLIDSTVQSNSWAQGCELASASWEKLSLIHVWMCPGTVCSYISISKWLSPAPVSCAFTNR